MNTINSSLSLLALAIEVAKTVEASDGSKSRQKVGEVAVYVPTLESFGLQVAIKTDAEGQPLKEDGLPVYASDEYNWLMSAIAAQAKAQARNKLVSGTADLKPGQTIATTLAELCAESTGGNSGAALAFIRELKKLFAAWVASLGKSPAAAARLNDYFGSRKMVELADATAKEKFSGYVADFAETLDETTLANAQRYLQSLLDACSAEIAADDF